MEILETLNLKLGEIQSRSLLVIKITHGISDIQEVQVMCEHLKTIAAKYPDQVDVLVIGKNMELELCPEKHMNGLGWFRKNDDGTAKIA